MFNKIQREKDRKAARENKKALRQTATNNNVTNFRDRLRKIA